MIEFLAKIALLISVPVGVPLFWKRRSGAAWTCLIAALIAYAIYLLIWRPMDAVFPNAVRSLVDSTILRRSLWSYEIVMASIYILIGEGMRYLFLRYAATSLRTWHDGVLFGLGWGGISALDLLRAEFFHNVSDMGLSQYSLAGQMRILNGHYLYGWLAIIYRTVWKYGLAALPYQVATALAVLYTVRRDLRFFLVVIALNGFGEISHHTATSLLPPEDILAPIQILLIAELIHSVLPQLISLFLIFYLRKSWGFTKPDAA